jgi:hypothetical protein
MLSILGSHRRACDGVTRREMLRAGSLGALGLGLADLLRGRATAGAAESPAPGFGKARNCIILYLYGAASQLETFDPKPEAPAEIRGEMGTIETAVPGLRICEGLPLLAAAMDRACVVRSMTHPYNIHSAAYTFTGVPHVDIPMELNPYDGRHWPFIGSVLDYLAQQADPAAAPPAVPRNVGLPFQFSSRCGEFTRGGPYGGFLGQAYNPVWTEFEGEATRTLLHWRGDRDQPVRDPYGGITPEGRFVVSRFAQLPAEMTLDAAPRAFRGRGRADARPVPGDGLVADRLPRAARRAGHPARAGRAPRGLRDDALRPGGPGRAATRRSREPAGDRRLGRVRHRQ